MTSYTAPTTVGPGASERVTARSTSWRRFARHYIVMVLAMYAGMRLIAIEGVVGV